MTGLNSREQSSQCRVRWLLIAICSERPVWCRLFRVYPLDSCKNHSKSWSLDECTGASFYHNTIVALMVSDGNLMSLKSDIEPSRWCNFSWFNDTLYHWEEWYQYLKGPATNQLQCSVSHSVLNNMYLRKYCVSHLLQLKLKNYQFFRNHRIHSVLFSGSFSLSTKLANVTTIGMFVSVGWSRGPEERNTPMIAVTLLGPADAGGRSR